MLADLTSFDTKFAAYKSTLTPDDIKRLAKFSAADIAYLDMALTYAQQNPTTLPANISVTELAKDIALAKQIVTVNAKAEQEANQTRASLIAVLSDASVTSRAIYRTAQAQGRTPETTAFLDAFGARFAHAPTPTPTPTPTPPPGT